MPEKNQKLSEMLVQLIGLRFPPVAVKMVGTEEAEPAGAERPMRDWGKHIALCQAFAFARRQGKTIYMEKKDHWCWNPILTYGLIDKELGRAGFRAMNRSLGAPEEQSDSFVEGFPYLPSGRYRGTLAAPLDKADFEPDVTLIYCKNDQLRVLLMAIDSQTHAMLESSFTPFDSCTYSVVPAMLEGKYRVTIPDPGEYERGLTPEDDIILSVPKQRAEEFRRGVERQLRAGGRAAFYPTMKEEFPQPAIYRPLFETWGLYDEAEKG